MKKKSESITVKCRNCEDEIDLEDTTLFRHWNKPEKKWEIFCSSSCCSEVKMIIED